MGDVGDVGDVGDMGDWGDWGDWATGGRSEWVGERVLAIVRVIGLAARCK
jgi:hypothetical protein